MKNLAMVLAAALFCGCQTIDVGPGSMELDQETSDVDFLVKETKTLSNLAKIETAVADYIKNEKKIPIKLSELVPKYLATIPSVDIGVGRHKESTDVKYYPADIIEHAEIDGTRLKDTGDWGYVFTERQIIVFVDCTHRDSKGSPWYRARGIY